MLRCLLDIVEAILMTPCILTIFKNTEWLLLYCFLSNISLQLANNALMCQFRINIRIEKHWTGFITYRIPILSFHNQRH